MTDFHTIPNARQRAILRKRYPCACRGKGCTACGGRGYLGDRSSYAQTVNLRHISVIETDTDLSGGLPF